MMNHGVSGYACLGQAGDFQTQLRGEPLENIVNDPIQNYLDAQNHIGIPLSNFNEPWSGGILAEGNFNASPYPKALWSEPLVGPPGPSPIYQTITSIDYPSLIGETYPQQLPSARIATEVSLPVTDRQNLSFEVGTTNGDNKVFMPATPIGTNTNMLHFLGSAVSAAVHPNDDKAGQQTTANTSRSTFAGGQAPYQKLPDGTSVGSLLPGEAPALWEMAPPPDPQVLPGEGTAPLRPTAPAWW